MLTLLVLYEVEVLQCADHIFYFDGSHVTQLLQTDTGLIVLQHLTTRWKLLFYRAKSAEGYRCWLTCKFRSQTIGLTPVLHTLAESSVTPDRKQEWVQGFQA